MLTEYELHRECMELSQDWDFHSSSSPINDSSHQECCPRWIGKFSLRASMHWYWVYPIAYKSASEFVEDQHIIEQGAENTISFLFHVVLYSIFSFFSVFFFQRMQLFLFILSPVLTVYQCIFCFVFQPRLFHLIYLHKCLLAFIVTIKKYDKTALLKSTSGRKLAVLFWWGWYWERWTCFVLHSPHGHVAEESREGWRI